MLLFQRSSVRNEFVDQSRNEVVQVQWFYIGYLRGYLRCHNEMWMTDSIDQFHVMANSHRPPPQWSVSRKVFVQASAAAAALQVLHYIDSSTDRETVLSGRRY